MQPSSRIGLYGGTFDPIHRGHVDTLRAVAGAMGWSRVVIVPAHVQPFKVGRRVSSPLDRHAMAVLATVDDPLFEVSRFELERGQVSYTVDTLEHFRRAEPDSALEWVIGDDNLALLPEWKSIDRIFELANFVILRRDAAAIVPTPLAHRVRDAAGRDAAGCIVLADNPIIEISGTEIRRRAAMGQPVGALVDSHVAAYISRYRLYQSQEEA